MRIIFILLGYLMVAAVVMAGTSTLMGDRPNWLAYALLSTFFCLVLFGALVRVRWIDFGWLLLLATIIAFFAYQSSVTTGSVTDLRFYPVPDWFVFAIRSTMLVLPVAAGVLLRQIADFIRRRLSGGPEDTYKIRGQSELTRVLRTGLSDGTS